MKSNPKENKLYYGKGDVFAYRTYAKPLTGISHIPESMFTGRHNIILGANIKVKIGGKAFEPSFVEGENSLVIATDSMKNFIQRHLAYYEGSTLEGFSEYVSKAFFETYSHIDYVSIIAEEIPFTVVSEVSDGSLKASDLVFKKSRNERSRSSMEMIRMDDALILSEQSSSIMDLQLIKVSGSSFEDFVEKELEDSNRPLYIYLNIHWIYKEQSDAFGETPGKYVAAEQVVDLVTSIFHNTETTSIQYLLYEIGCMMLRRFPQLLEVTFESQNHVWETVVTEIPDSDGKVYTEPRPPYSFQLFTVTQEHVK